MTRLDERIADAERKRSLVERYAPVVDAAGYLDGTLELTPEECFLLALSIIHDKEITRLSWDAWRPGTARDYVGAIESLSDDERTALRARVNYKPSKIMRGGPAR